MDSPCGRKESNTTEWLSLTHSLSWLSGKESIYLPMQETCVWSLGQEDHLEGEMSTCSNILAQNIAWTEKPGRPTVPTGVTKSQAWLKWWHMHTQPGIRPSSQTQYFHDDKVFGGFFRADHLNTPILTSYRWKSSQDWNCPHPSSNPHPSKVGKKRVFICPLLWCSPWAATV